MNTVPLRQRGARRDANQQSLLPRGASGELARPLGLDLDHARPSPAVCRFVGTNPAQIPWIEFDMGASAPDPNLMAMGDALCRAEWGRCKGKQMTPELQL